jgi:hypothetical protein
VELPGLGLGGDACLGLFSSCVFPNTLLLPCAPAYARLVPAMRASFVFLRGGWRCGASLAQSPGFASAATWALNLGAFPAVPCALLGGFAVVPFAGVRSCVRALILTYLCLPAYGRKSANHIIITCETRRAAPPDEGMPSDRTRPRRRHGRRHSSRNVVDCCDFACVLK